MPPGHIQALMKPMAATLSMPREWVELMAQAATICRFEQGQLLQVEGDSAEAMYIARGHRDRPRDV